MEQHRRTAPISAEGSEHLRVEGEWSMVETMRHLVFVHDSWFRRCVMGLTESFTSIGLGPSTHHGFCVRDLNKLAIQNVPDETN